jgi:hypothetical protein
MQTFYQYLTEVQWQGSLSEKLFKPAAGMANGVWIPLSNAQLKKIQPKQVRTKVFHVTGYGENVKKIVKLQGSKKSISAFTSMNSLALKTGIQGGGGVIFELDANVLGSFSDDIMSKPDKSGRRWTALFSLVIQSTESLDGDGDLGTMEDDMDNLIFNLSKKYKSTFTQEQWSKRYNTKIAEFDFKNRDPEKMIEFWIALGQMFFYHPDSKSALKNLIKDYFDGVDKTYKKNSKILQKVLFGHLGDRNRNNPAYWDELIVNDFKVDLVHVFEDEYIENDYEGFTKALGNIPFMSWHSMDLFALQSHIADVADRERKKFK